MEKSAGFSQTANRAAKRQEGRLGWRAALAKTSVAVFAAMLALAGCTSVAEPDRGHAVGTEGSAAPLPSAEAGASSQTAKPTASPSPLPPAETRVSLAAVGDVLIHGSIYRDALRRGGGGSYDFKPMFAEVASMLEEPDVTFANSESIIGGTALGLSDYPRFNSPHEVGDALKAAGVDIVSTANNHTMDRGEAAVLSALEYWDKIGVCAAGSAAEAGGRSSCTLERRGMTMTFLAYTYGTNGIAVPAGKEHLVNLIDRDRISSDIRAARSKADAVIVSLHFGNEYQTMPNEEQKSLAKLAVDSGAHVVLGHHAHVLQPTEWLPTPDGGQALVVYSLGNFLAAQEAAKFERRLGGILSLELVRRLGPDGRLTVTVEKPRFVPTYIEFSAWKNFRIVPFTKETKLEGGISAAAKYEEYRKHMTQWMPELAYGLPER
ncbi:CapA family protein [Paenibacillus thermoaerophilus]|uniref:CapA family protein n=1 Tax=Paenibacillus thermoaerophilus TaxID=1215385 RepID=A0ABW2V0R9_9BACL|nr:CapA family protein [Paenibacillus thermoaerophilus]